MSKTHKHGGSSPTTSGGILVDIEVLGTSKRVVELVVVPRVSVVAVVAMEIVVLDCGRLVHVSLHTAISLQHRKPC